MRGKKTAQYAIVFLALMTLSLLLTVFLFRPTSERRNTQQSEPKKTLSSLLEVGNKNEITYSGWIPYWKEEKALETIQNVKRGVLSEINPVWYTIDENGDFVKSNEDESPLTELAKSKKIKIVPTVTNVTSVGFDPERVSVLLANKEKVIEDISELAVENGYSGWDLDLEEIKQKDKDEYVVFVKELAQKLDENNLTLSVTVHAQSGLNDWTGTKGQDIKRIAEYADFVRVMAYDFHNSTSGAGAITPNDDLIRTIKYTLENVETKKTVMCLPTYGYDWSKNGVVPLQHEDAKKLVESESIEIRRNDDSFELTGEYSKDGAKHVVWYQDAAATFEKINVIKKFGITNICFWHLGGEDGEMWEKVN